MAGRRRFRRFRRYVSSGRHRVSRGLARVRRVGRSLTGAFPAWAKPSRVAAYTGVGVGLAELAFTPLSNGDSWQRRLFSGYSAYKQSGDLVDLLNYDANGNGTIEVAVAQVKANAPGAIGTMVGFGIGGAILNFFGM